MIKEARIEDSEDRLSSLPDAVLTHLLSFLETKESVRTSVLSTRWKSLWSSVPTLKLDIFNFRLKGEQFNSLLYGEQHREIRARYLSFVGRVLMDRTMPFLEKVSITDNCRDHSHMVTWICALVEKNVRELDLVSVWGSMQSPQELPQSLFSCNTLVVLKLRLALVLNYSACSTSFPNLKVLELKFIIYKDDNSAQHLVSSCPLLENLFIQRGNGDGLVTLNVSSRSLKNLVLWLDDDLQKMVIEAPALESICINDFGTCDYVVRDVSSLIKAKLHHFSDKIQNFTTPIFKLLRGICGIKSLCVSRSALVSLSAASSYNLPVFHHLTHLKFFDDDSDCYSCSWELIIEFLKSSPLLEVLVFKYFQFQGYVSWDDDDDVPKCLHSHLKTIKILNFDNSEDERDKVGYLLENAVLENMTINLEKIRKTISWICKGSGRCQLKFL